MGVGVVVKNWCMYVKSYSEVVLSVRTNALNGSIIKWICEGPRRWGHEGVDL